MNNMLGLMFKTIIGRLITGVSLGIIIATIINFIFMINVI